MIDKSWITVLSPIYILTVSPLNITLWKSEEFYPILTFPIITQLGAIHEALVILGNLIFYFEI